MKLLLLLLVGVTLIQDISCLSCYSCNSNEANCEFPDKTTPVNQCSSEKDVCYTTASYARANTSVPFPRLVKFFERKCETPTINACNLNHPEYGPCIKFELNINCINCCNDDKCTLALPTFSDSTATKVSTLLLGLVTSVSLLKLY